MIYGATPGRARRPSAGSWSSSLKPGQADSPITVPSAAVAHSALVSLGRRLAVSAGAAAALVSLYFDVPVRIACLRGALVFAAALLVARWSSQMLEHSLAQDGRRRSGGGGA